MSDERELVRLSALTDSGFDELQAGLLQLGRQGPRAAQRARMRAALGLPVLPVSTPHPQEPYREAQSQSQSQPAQEPSPRHEPGSQPRSNPPPQPEPNPQSQPRPNPELHAASGAGRAHGLLLKLALSGVVVAGVLLGVWHSPSHRPAREPVGASGTTTTVPPHTNALADLQTASPDAVATPPLASKLASTPHALSGRLARSDIRRGSRAHAVRGADARPLSNPAGELALLRRARAQTRSAPEHALELIVQCQQRYPNPAFAEEREVIAVEALLALGRTDQARQRATDFFAHFPASAHARRMHVLLDDDSDTNPTQPPHR